VIVFTMSHNCAGFPQKNESRADHQSSHPVVAFE
jgi:hypothetical protein